jgi:transcriptional regulator of heat shock response
MKRNENVEKTFHEKILNTKSKKIIKSPGKQKSKPASRSKTSKSTINDDKSITIADLQYQIEQLSKQIHELEMSIYDEVEDLKNILNDQTKYFAGKMQILEDDHIKQNEEITELLETLLERS